MSVNSGVNKHIALVKKWLADKDSVSKEELKANRDVAYAAYAAAYAAYVATNAAYDAAYAAAYDAYDAAAYWVARYEELIDEQRDREKD